MIGGWRKRRSSFLAIISSASSVHSVARWRNVASAVARLFKRYSETLLTLFTGNPLLRSVLGSVIAVLIVIGGVLSALHLLGMTEAVLSFRDWTGQTRYCGWGKPGPGIPSLCLRAQRDKNSLSASWSTGFTNCPSKMGGIWSES